MIPPLDFTHDARRTSWVDSAEDPSTDFPLQNLPLGVFRPLPDAPSRIGCAIGDQVLDLQAAADAGLLPDSVAPACRKSSLNGLMELGPAAWTALRHGLSELLGADSAPAATRQKAKACLMPATELELLLPAAVGDYTDFYASIHHATNVGTMLRPDQPLLPNYKWVPIGYHGRSSSLVSSGAPIRRPSGQRKPADAPSPTYGPSQNLDYELELGFFVGPGNSLGQTIPLAEAPRHLFGVTLLNDWSARDLQAWEYQPLGPFLAKNFATTLSPWVVTFDALRPYRAPAAPRPPGDPAPLPHLADPSDATQGALALTLEVYLASARMRAEGRPPHRLSRAHFQDMYWTPAQLLAHHASNGCNLRPGDLLGSGTVSGPEKSARGCLLELTWRGAEPLPLPDGEERRFLQDGDEVILRGHAERVGFRRIGLGECRGRIVPAT